jgi:hypothetical protein
MSGICTPALTELYIHLYQKYAIASRAAPIIDSLEWNWADICGTRKARTVHLKDSEAR